MRRRRLLYAFPTAVFASIAGCLGGDGDSDGDGDGNGNGNGGGDSSGSGDAGGSGGDESTPTAPAEPTDSPTAAATPEPTPPPTPTDSPAPTDSPTPTGTPTVTPSPAPEADKVVTVGPDGRLVFRPETFEISAGDTVRWEWDSPGHNVSPESQPSDASWPGDDETTYPAGRTYTYTFTVTGRYVYHCDPHQSVGMRGSFNVR